MNLLATGILCLSSTIIFQSEISMLVADMKHNKAQTLKHKGEPTSTAVFVFY